MERFRCVKLVRFLLFDVAALSGTQNVLVFFCIIKTCCTNEEMGRQCFSVGCISCITFVSYCTCFEKKSGPLLCLCKTCVGNPCWISISCEISLAKFGQLGQKVKEKSSNFLMYEYEHYLLPEGRSSNSFCRGWMDTDTDPIWDELVLDAPQ